MLNLDDLYIKLTSGINEICKKSHNYRTFFEGRKCKYTIERSIFNYVSKDITFFLDEIFDCEKLCFKNDGYNKWADYLFSLGKNFTHCNVIAKRIMFYYMASAGIDIHSIEKEISRLTISHFKEVASFQRAKKLNDKFKIVDNYIIKCLDGRKLSHKSLLKQLYLETDGELNKEFIIFFSLHLHLGVRISEIASLTIDSILYNEIDNIIKIKRTVKKLRRAEYKYDPLNNFCLIDELMELKKKNASSKFLFSRQLFFRGIRIATALKTKVRNMRYINPLSDVIIRYVNITHLARYIQINLLYYLGKSLEEILYLTGHTNVDILKSQYISPEVDRIVRFNKTSEVLDCIN